MRGIEHVDSLSFNPNKWMLINYDASCLWVKDKYILTKALSIDPVYLQYRQMEKAIDYRNWGISLSRRFRSLKLWFTIRSYGVSGIQEYIRHHVSLAKEFEKLVRSDERFEIFGKVTLGLVCFRLKGPEILSKNLLFLLNDSGDIHMTPTIVNDRYIIRYCVNAKQATLDDMKTSWDLIRQAADKTYLEYHQKFKTFTPETGCDESNASETMDDDENNANLSIMRLRRKTFTRIVSEPTKHTQAYSLNMRSSFAIDLQYLNNNAKTKSLDVLQETFDENSISLNEI
jgi:glutamate/tyrosine decarboxylase-like PLP-dependent enzyme